jgi:hypothetical protein
MNLAQKWQEDARAKYRVVVAVLQHEPDLACKNPHSGRVVSH